jgi:hypothetical protein
MSIIARQTAIMGLGLAVEFEEKATRDLASPQTVAMGPA